MKNDAIRLARGQRNCNPMNIIRNNSAWKGMKEKQTDKQFIQFESTAYGIRAAIILLTKYHAYQGLRQVPTIVHRWAPDGGDAERNYIRFVTNELGRVDVEDTKHDLYNMMKAMCFFESHYVLSERVFEDAMKLVPVQYSKYWR